MTATALGVAAVLAISVAACGDETTATGGGDAHGVVEPDGVGPAPGQRAGETRPGRVHDQDRQPLLADEPGQQVGLQRDRHPGHAREGRRRGHRQDQDDRQRGRGQGDPRHGHRERQPVEITDDWYAQDSDGNIWYLGEATAEYKNGKVASTAGSFEAGVDGAQAGIAMPANPEPGMSYRQEYYKGVAEDKGAVITVGEEQVEVPFGHFNTDVLMTRDLVPLEPKVQELKFYAPGVGPLLSVHTDGAGGRAELVSYTPGK